jgi:hypothetical protein
MAEPYKTGVEITSDELMFLVIRYGRTIGISGTQLRLMVAMVVY